MRYTEDNETALKGGPEVYLSSSNLRLIEQTIHIHFSLRDRKTVSHLQTFANKYVYIHISKKILCCDVLVLQQCVLSHSTVLSN